MLGVGLVGAVVERLILRRLRQTPIEIPMLATVALSVIIQNAAILIWDPSPKTIKHVFSPLPLTLGPIHVVSIRVFAGLVAVALIVGSHLLIQKTRIGRAMRATFQDTDMARLAGRGRGQGLHVHLRLRRRAARAPPALSSAPVFWVYPGHGRPGRPQVLRRRHHGWARQLPRAPSWEGCCWAYRRAWAPGISPPGYKDAIGFVLIILLLLWRPQGLFGKKVLPR